MIFATIYFCLLGSTNIPQKCDQYQLRVESAACKIPELRGQIAENGEWKNAIIKVKCK